jgi:hypothetical protein
LDMLFREPNFKLKLSYILKNTIHIIIVEVE